MPLIRIGTAIARILFYRTAAWLKPVKRKGPTERQIREFFGDRSNFANGRIAVVVEALGTWQDYDDWDLGRFIYWWKSPELYVRVNTKSNTITSVHFFQPKQAARCGDGELVWSQTTVEDDEHA